MLPSHKYFIPYSFLDSLGVCHVLCCRDGTRGCPAPRLLGTSPPPAAEPAAALGPQEERPAEPSKEDICPVAVGKSTSPTAPGPASMYLCLAWSTGRVNLFHWGQHITGKPSICMSVPSGRSEVRVSWLLRCRCEESTSFCPRAARLRPCKGRRVQRRVGGFRSPGARLLLRLGWREFGGGSSGPAVACVCTGAGQGTATSYRSVGLGEVSFVCPSRDPRAY